MRTLVIVTQFVIDQIMITFRVSQFDINKEIHGNVTYETRLQIIFFEMADDG